MANKPEENLTNLSFPMRGIDLENPFDLQPPFTTPTGVNVRGYEPITLRARGGSRPGLEVYADVLPTGSVIQHLEALVDPQAEALTADFELEPLPQWEYMDDPSTNNLRTRNRGRRVRVGGSGRQENIHIGKQRVVITWADPADITQGTPLDGTQLNATAASTLGFPIAGSFTYLPASGTVLDLGDQRPLKATFTPTDADLYSSATKTVHINVVSGKIATHIVANPSTIYSTNVTLGEVGFNFATNADFVQGLDTNNQPVAGVIAFTPALSTIAPVGPGFHMRYDFTPTNTATYETSTLTGVYDVFQGTLTATGIVTDASDFDAVAVGSVMASRSGLPAESHADVVCAPDPIHGPHGFPELGGFLGCFYDYGAGAWYY